MLTTESRQLLRQLCSQELIYNKVTDLIDFNIMTMQCELDEYPCCDVVFREGGSMANDESEPLTADQWLDICGNLISTATRLRALITLDRELTALSR